MEEQSHKDEMQAALRGDFERLRARERAGEPAPTARASTPESATLEARTKAGSRLLARLLRRE